MDAPGVRTYCGRLIVAIVLAGTLTFLPGAESSARPVDPSVRNLAALTIGPMTVRAQGGMDVGVATPTFSTLPRSVLPGGSFDIGVNTAAGARCAGRVTFRDHPPIALPDTPAPGGSCSWRVDVPPTVRPSTGIIVVDLTRSGQMWSLYGIIYVSPIGETR